MKKSFVIFLISGFAVMASAASNQTFLLDGHVDNADGSAVTATTATIVLQIKSPAPSECLLWGETHTGVTLSKGDFTVEIGIPGNRDAAAAGGAALSFESVFINNPGLSHTGATCTSGTSYSPGVTDDRVLSATVTPNGGSTITLANLPLKSAPFAMQAHQIGGYGIANLMKISAGGSTVVYSPTEAQTLKDLLGGNIDWNMNGHRITNVAAPTAATDVATKAYVDSVAGGGGGGTVTLVTGTAPIAVATGTTSPVISISQAGASTDGYLSSTHWNNFNSKLGAFTSQGQNTVFAGPTSGSGVPTFRTLAASDIPNIDAAKITSGVIPPAQLGSGTANTSTFLRGDGQWTTPAGGADNLGNHTATANISLGSNWISGDGTPKGIRVDASGNVGIGTASPTSPVHVYTTSTSTTMAGSAALRLFNESATPGNFVHLALSTVNHIGAPIEGAAIGAQFKNHISGSEATDIYFQTGNTGTMAERMRITSTGKVGIGTTTPTAPLEVMGNAIINGVSVGRGNSNISSNTGVGAFTLSSISSGNTNVAVGANSSKYLTTGTANTSIGFNALQNETSGNDNVAIGMNALMSSAGSSNNVAIGTYAMTGAGSKMNNVAIGHSALASLTGGTENTSVGDGSGSSITTGSSNTLIGRNVGNNLTTGSGNLLIGAHGTGNLIDTPSPGTSNFLNINNVIFATGTTGSVGAPAGNVGIGTAAPAYNLHVVGTAGLSSGTAWTNASDARLKDIRGDYEFGLREILQLRTVRFNYKKGNALNLPSNHSMTGFIAQEVQQVIPDAISKGPGGFLQLNADPIHWAVVNAVKDLYSRWSEDSRELKEENARLRDQVDQLKAWSCTKDPSAPFCEQTKAPNSP